MTLLTTIYFTVHRSEVVWKWKPRIQTCATGLSLLVHTSKYLHVVSIFTTATIRAQTMTAKLNG